ncbi:MAG: hypothetical protein WAT72_00730 [Microgenomates group bacterium]|jgi:hypothetical protein|nr:hypothetical protein [Candidatus Woesebacteria bacterium]QQR63962.1 MAG: hypothetical protein IPH70_00260 [Candidatus Roizmanbacteria bacterium]
MSPDRSGEASFGRVLPKVNPFHELPNDQRLRTAAEVGQLYTDFYQAPPKTNIAPHALTERWFSLLNDSSISQKARVGVAQLHEILEAFHRSKLKPVATESPNSTLEVSTPSPTRDFLLDVFHLDPRITSSDLDERLSQIYLNLTLDLFGDSALGNTQKRGPDVNRMKRIELFFTHEPIDKAVEFFMIEPSLLPSVPTNHKDEK